MKFICFLGLALLFSACSSTIQTTSGTDYLSARNVHIDPDIAEAANGEPDLQFPARIGVGRIDSRGLLSRSEKEKNALRRLQANSMNLGSIVPLIPFQTPSQARNGIHHARLTAARQHLDYVLLYELNQTGRGIGAKGRIDVFFVDVRNGYIYGHLSSHSPLAGFGAIRSGWRRVVPTEAGATHLIDNALPAISEMITELVSASHLSNDG